MKEKKKKKTKLCPHSVLTDRSSVFWRVTLLDFVIFILNLWISFCIAFFQKKKKILDLLLLLLSLSLLLFSAKNCRFTALHRQPVPEKWHRWPGAGAGPEWPGARARAIKVFHN